MQLPLRFVARTRATRCCVVPALAATSVLAVVALLPLSFGNASAQGLFGKNKVLYERLDWRVLTTPHVEVHYYPEEEGLARQLAAIAESTACEFDTTFRMKPRRPIPILFYSSHQMFQQSHATQGFIGEGTGGLTELIKGRVLIPHTGSYHRLRWVTRHELVHAYMLEKLAQVRIAKKRYSLGFPPLWYTEGLAEFLSTTWDSQAEGLLQEAVVTGSAYPIRESWPIEGTVLMYKEGQSFLMYLAEHHGREKVIDMLENWWRAPSFEQVFKITYGIELAEADDDWFQGLRKRFYPLVATRRDVAEKAKPLTCCSNSYNLAPCVVPQAEGDSTRRIAYLRATETGAELRLRTERPGQPVDDRRLLRGGFSSRFESFHFFNSRLGASRDQRLAVVAQRGGRDVLYVFDLKQKQPEAAVASWGFKGLVGLSSPTWLPGDSMIVLSGQALSGQKDLYRVRVADGAVTQLTDDPSDDEDPSAHPTRPEVVFASDREGGDRGSYHLFGLDLENGSVRQLTSGGHSETDPTWSPDGSSLLFLSDREGIDDLYVWRDGHVQRASRFLGPVYDPAWSPDGKSILFASQSDYRFHLFEVPLAPVDTLWIAESTDSLRLGHPDAPVATDPSEEYRKQYSMDIAQSLVALDPTVGGGGGAGGMVAFSDVLGNEGFSLFLSNDASSLGEFLDGMELGVTYFNRAQRFQYGVGAFRLTRIYDADFDAVRRERRAGVSLLAAYPLSKFTRLEGSTVLRYAQDHMLRNGDVGNLWMVSNFVAYVHDNARFTFHGPAGGSRFNITGGFTRDLSTGQGDFFTLATDFRHYTPLIRDVVLANRVAIQSSFGDDQEHYYLGGSSSLRGYDRRSIRGTKTATMQTEVRFPILSRFRMGIPVPIEFPRVSVALFADVALAGNVGDSFQQAGATGVGVFTGGGYFPVLRLDFVRAHDFRGFTSGTQTYFSIGYLF
ncbi:MAG: BamA/TamA family outer membrane protein [Candidatus Eiseniibacteriota bacterium]